MTVSELIAALQQMPAEAFVVVHDRWAFTPPNPLELKVVRDGWGNLIAERNDDGSEAFPGLNGDSQIVLL